MRNLDGAVAVIEAALLLGPPAALAIYFILRLSSRRALSWVLKFVVAYSAIILFLGAIGLRFTAVTANIASVALIWPAWCFCCAHGCRAKWLAVRALAWLVVVPSVGLGYLLGTVGYLGLLFIVGDIVTTPIQDQSFETPDLTCEATLWGGPGAGSGYSVVVYRKWTAVPWLRFRLTEATVDQTAGDQGVSCAELAAQK